ncbi:SecY-interacting protein [Shewanella benthica]|uniref:Protein Syd n=1 Tax=Shewanella benthica KT99 TaxID=314608 RepID=A9DDC7_9GAMM|nr:SecY-interacting protein [Shewanella benthica]EDQ00225.1 SecY interacting protein Syd [Shewanella benthica KT99]
MSSLPALDDFLKLYQLTYLEKLGESPRYYPRGEGSLCIEGEFDASNYHESNEEVSVCWKPVKREEPGSFANVETALGIELGSDIDAFFGEYFSAPLLFNCEWGQGELLQVWNQTDFEYLQQNMIGHLMMKKKLKQAPTWFIGVLGDGDKMLTVDNSDGSVWVEIPGEAPSEKLTNSLNEFIALLTPRVAPPELHIEESMPELDHPGIWNRFKLMWRNLRGK